MKIFRWIGDNILFICTLFLLAFIPLYPKLPLLDIQHTWVYIRIEDFIIAVCVLMYLFMVLRRKVSWKTPLTMPIIGFWAVGAISTLYAILFIFPNLTNVFPNLAILHYLRRIEYISVFFIAFAAMKEKAYLKHVIILLTTTLFIVFFYGIGQRYWGFPAFLTMNEEFAKGIPLKLSAAGRVPSTFAGHYDLAAYLVLLIPMMGSLVFGYRNLLAKGLFLLASVAGLILLLMTESRTSFGVYLLTISFMLVLHKQKKFIIPVIIASIVILNFFDGISSRFGSTFAQTDVIVDARTGKVIGVAGRGANNELIVEEKESTGENLPTGSQYINIPGSTVEKEVDNKVIKKVLRKTGDKLDEITTVEGDFVVRKSLAYDISFTTRFQGTWPRALKAFSRNYLLGSGYSSINLASDGNYFRILGEVGLLGLAAFALIFLSFSIYAYYIVPSMQDKPAKSFILGLLAGIFGLALNAILIDVFEASKVAFIMWTLIGIGTAILVLYQKKKISLAKELRSVLTSPIALLLYLLVSTIGFFWMMLNNFFVGDDFTWLRWVADCKKIIIKDMMYCDSTLNTITSFFTESGGFFYRPGTKLYFFLMYAVAWFSPFLYHVISMLLHFIATACVFLISLKILNRKLFAFITALLFVSLSVHAETIFWISSVGHLLTSVSILFGLVTYVYWKDSRNIILFPLSLISIFIAPFFHESGVIAPFIIIAYELLFGAAVPMRRLVNKWYLLIFLVPLPFYFFMKYISDSLWAAGDYQYNLMKFIPNAVGNAFSYVIMTFFGTRSLPFLQQMRDIGKDNIVIVVVGILAIFGIVFLKYRYFKNMLLGNDKRALLFGGAFFLLTALPFLGLGNVAARYAYLPSFGLLLIIMTKFQALSSSLRSFKNKYILFAISLLLLGCIVWQKFELDRINKDWQQAGKITNNLLINMGSNFASSQKRLLPKDPIFYYVNVPTKHGEAWVFPVGLPDALWFTFQNEQFTVRTKSNLQEAIQETQGLPNALLFEFGEDGEIAQILVGKEQQ